MGAKIRIGIVDSGSSPAQTARIGGAVAPILEDGQLCLRGAAPDRLGHGSRVVAAIAGRVEVAELYIAQVFRDRLATTPEQVAAAIDWLVTQEVALINLSLGLRMPRVVLADACSRALEAGAILCAAAPARGAPVYPAGFTGVLRMTGDARCAMDEISALGTEASDYGAYVRPLDGALAGSGASMGCAHLSAHIGQYLAAGGDHDVAAVRRWLDDHATYHGPEQRRG